MLTNDIKISKDLIKKLAKEFNISPKDMKKQINRTLGDANIREKLNNNKERIEE